MFINCQCLKLIYVSGFVKMRDCFVKPELDIEGMQCNLTHLREVEKAMDPSISKSARRDLVCKYAKPSALLDPGPCLNLKTHSGSPLNLENFETTLSSEERKRDFFKNRQWTREKNNGHTEKVGHKKEEKRPNPDQKLHDIGALWANFLFCDWCKGVLAVVPVRGGCTVVSMRRMRESPFWSHLDLESERKRQWNTCTIPFLDPWKQSVKTTGRPAGCGFKQGNSAPNAFIIVTIGGKN